MRNVDSILLIGLIICMLTAFPLASKMSIGHASPAPRIYCDPTNNNFYSNTTNIGLRFNVTVWVEDIAVNIGGAQIYLEFNDDVINVTRWWAPDWDAAFFMADPYSALPTPPNPGYVHLGAEKGRVQVTVLKGGLPPVAPWGHDGKICILEFNITAAPSEGGALTSTLRIDAIDTYLLDGEGSEIPGLAKENGTYAFVNVPSPVVPHIWLGANPASFEATKLRSFSISVNIWNVSESDGLIGIQFEVHYNSTFLETIEIVPGDFLSNSTWAPYDTVSTFYAEDGRAVYGELILPNSTGHYDMTRFPEGDGTVATITFMPLLHEAVEFTITVDSLFGEFLLDKEGEYVPYAPATGCQYTFNPLPLSLLAVAPDMNTASSVGEVFSIDITITGLDAEWKLTYVEFELAYDENVLEVLDVTEGVFMAGFGTTEFLYEQGANYVKINITLTPNGEYPFGSGTLATILFNVTRSPGACALTLDTEMLDFETEKVLHDVQSGYYRLHEVLIHPIIWDGETYPVITVSNASITPVPMEFNQSHRMLVFNVTNENGTVGFVEVTIPKILLDAPTSGWLLSIDGEIVEPTVGGNATHTTLIFNVSLSTRSVYIAGTSAIPEFTSNALLLILLIIIMMSLATAKKIRLKKREAPI